MLCELIMRATLWYACFNTDVHGNHSSLELCPLARKSHHLNILWYNIQKCSKVSENIRALHFGLFMNYSAVVSDFFFFFIEACNVYR